MVNVVLLCALLSLTQADEWDAVLDDLRDGKIDTQLSTKWQSELEILKNETISEEIPTSTQSIATDEIKRTQSAVEKKSLSKDEEANLLLEELEKTLSPFHPSHREASSLNTMPSTPSVVPGIKMRERPPESSLESALPKGQRSRPSDPTIPQWQSPKNTDSSLKAD